MGAAGEGTIALCLHVKHLGTLSITGWWGARGDDELGGLLAANGTLVRSGSSRRKGEVGEDTLSAEDVRAVLQNAKGTPLAEDTFQADGAQLGALGLGFGPQCRQQTRRQALHIEQLGAGEVEAAVAQLKTINQR